MITEEKKVELRQLIVSHRGSEPLDGDAIDSFCEKNKLTSEEKRFVKEHEGDIGVISK